MTVTAPTPASTPTAGWRKTIAEFGLLSKRSVLAIWRQPATWIPGLFFPLMLAAVYSAQFAKATDIPGFPEVDSFLTFLLPAGILQGCAFGANAGATELAVDIEGGFIDRLLSSPVNRVGILLSRLVGSMAFGAVQATFLGLVFLLFGANIEGGVLSFLSMVIIGAAISLAIGSLGVVIALRTGSKEVVQSTFPLIFVLLFVSSAFFPTQLMSGWYRTAAEANPFSWIIDASRRLTVEGFSFGDLGIAVGVCAVVTAVGFALSLRALRWRLANA